MMHSTLHFAFGMLAATAWRGPAVWRAWTGRRPLARATGIWMATTYAFGLWAIVPNLLRRAGVPHTVCESWSMNLFLLSPLWNRLVRGGHTHGPALLTFLFMLQYGFLLAAIRRASAAHPAHPPPRQ